MTTEANRNDADGTATTAATVDIDTLKLFYEESRLARDRVQSIVDKYRANTATMLAVATAAVAFFGFADGPRQSAAYYVAFGCYGMALTMSFWIFAPKSVVVNVAYDTQAELFANPTRPLTPSDVYYGYAVGHQNAIELALKNIGGWRGLSARFRVLVVAIAAMVAAAAMSVAIGSKEPPQPTHVIVEMPILHP